MPIRIFCLGLLLSLCFSLAGPSWANDSVTLRYKPRLQEAMYTYYSKSDSLFTNGTYQKMVASNSQAYVGVRTMRTLENGHLVQRAGVHAGNIMLNDQVYAHPSLGAYMEYILAPWGGVPKALGNGTQFQIKNLQMVFPKTPVSVGSTWSVTLPKTPTFPVDTQVDYEVTNILGGLVIIHSKVNVEDTEVIPKLKFTLKGTAQIIFNADEGLLVRNESNQYVEVARPGKDGERSTKMNVNSILELQF